MADFTDKTAMGTNRMNPSSMVPGAMGGNAPQGGFRSQLHNAISGGKTPRLQMPQSGFSTQSTIQPGRTAMAQQQAASEQQANALMRQLMQQPNPAAEGANKFLPNDVRPMGAGQMLMEGLRNSPHISKRQDELPVEAQQMLPGKPESKNVKSKSYKKEDFGLLADVFKTLSER